MRWRQIFCLNFSEVGTDLGWYFDRDIIQVRVSVFSDSPSYGGTIEQTVDPRDARTRSNLVPDKLSGHVVSG